MVERYPELANRTNRYLCRGDNDSAGDVIVSVLVLRGTNCCSPVTKYLRHYRLSPEKEGIQTFAPFFLVYSFLVRNGEKHDDRLSSFADYLRQRPRSTLPVTLHVRCLEGRCAVLSQLDSQSSLKAATMVRLVRFLSISRSFSHLYLPSFLRAE